MDPITLLLFLMLFILPALAVYKSYIGKKKLALHIDQLPGPKWYPIVGTTFDMLTLPRKELWKANRRRARLFSPLYRSWFGSLPVVHMMKPEHLELVMNNSVQMTKGPTYDYMRPWLGEGLLTSTGSKWHRHRKLITPTFHFKILEHFQEVFQDKARILVEKLAPKADGKVFDIYPFITYCALDIICETAMGVQINALENAQSKYIQSVYEVSRIAMERNYQPLYRSNFIFGLTQTGAKFKECLQILHGFTNKVIKERKEALQSGKGKEEQINEDDLLLGKKKRQAFLDLLIEASRGGTVLTDTEIREEVDTFMFEGHDTTTAGICWTLFLLGNHQDVQEKVVQELDDIFQGDDRSVTVKDLAEMKYLERVVKESLRLYPSVPFIMRTLMEDIEVDGHKIPKHCAVVLQIYDAHRDTRFYPDPEKFNPDRFLPENSKNRHPYAYVPFSAGPRNCIGQKFALNEEKTVIASIIRKYKVQSVEKQEEMKLIAELILRPENGIKLRLEPRIRD